MRILHGHADTVRCLSYAPGGGYLATGGDDGSLRLWELSSGKEVHDFVHTGRVEALAFSSDGKYLLTGTVGKADGAIVVRNPPTGRPRVLERTVAGGVRSFAPAPDRPAVAILGWNRSGFLYELPSRRSKRLDTVSAKSCAAVAFHPDGTLLAAAAPDPSILLIDSARDRVRASLRATAPVLSLAFTPDGGWLAAGDARGGVTLWDVAAAKPHPLSSGHTWAVYAVAFTPCGKRLVSGGADGTVRLWDVRGRREVGAFRWHTSWVTCVAIAPDGMTAAAGSEDHTVVVWDLADD